MIRACCASVVLGFTLLVWPARAAEIAPYERGTFASIRAEHAGRPLGVHFWSVTCLPCLIEMPRLAALLRDRKDIDVVFVATDPIEQADRIQSRLSRFNLSNAANYAYADTFEERLRFEVDRSWRGELPFTALVTKSGTVSTVTGELAPDVVSEWLANAN